MTNNSNNKHESPVRYDKYLTLFNTDNSSNYAGIIKGRYFIDKLTKKAEDRISHNAGPIDTPADMKDFLVTHTLDFIYGYNDIAFNPTSRITSNDNDGNVTINHEWLLFFAKMANDLGGHIIRAGHAVFDALKKLQPSEEVDKILLLFYSNLILKYEINGGWADLGTDPIYDGNGRLTDMTGILFKDSLTLSDLLHSIGSLPHFNNITGRKEPPMGVHQYGVGNNPLFFKGINHINKLPILTIPVPLFGFNPLERNENNLRPVRTPAPAGGVEGHYINHPMIDHTNRVGPPLTLPTFCYNKNAATRGIRLWADDLHPLHLCASPYPGDFKGNVGGSIVDKIIKYVEDNGILNATAVCNTFKDLILRGAMESYNVNTLRLPPAAPAPGGLPRQMEVHQIYGPCVYDDLGSHINLSNLQNQSRLYLNDFMAFGNTYTCPNAKVLKLVRDVHDKLWCSPDNAVGIVGANGILVSAYSSTALNAGAAICPYVAGALAYNRKIAQLADLPDHEYNSFIGRINAKADDQIDYQVLLSSPETIIMQLHLFSKDTPITDYNLPRHIMNELLVLRHIEPQINWHPRHAILDNRFVVDGAAGPGLFGAPARLAFAASPNPNAINPATHFNYITNRAVIPYNNIINRFYTHIIYPLIFLLYNLKQDPANRNIIYALPQIAGMPAGTVATNVIGCAIGAGAGGVPTIGDAFGLLQINAVFGAAVGGPPGAQFHMYFLNGVTAPHAGIQYNAYIYIVQILNQYTDSYISHAYNQHYGREGGPPPAYGTAVGAAVGAIGGPRAYNNGVMTDPLLDHIINELITLDTLIADQGLAGANQTNAVLGWLKESYLVDIREYAKRFINTLPAPAAMPPVAWGRTYRAEQLNISELQTLTNKVLYNPVNHHKFPINRAEFNLLSNIMNEYLQYYNELRGNFLKKYTTAKYFSIDLKKLIDRQFEDKKNQLKKGVIQVSKRLGFTNERTDPYKFAILKEYDNKYSDKQQKNNSNNITYIYENDSIFVYDPSKPGNKGAELTIDEVRDSIDKEFTCNKTIGLNKKNVSPQEQQFICTNFLLDCIQGNDEANIAQCKEFMTDDDYWENAADEVDNIPLLMALQTLTAFGFEPEADVESNDDYVKMMDFDTWLNLLISNKSISGDASTPGTEAYKINQNVKLKGYLSGLVNRINMNPSIINKDFKHPDVKNSNNSNKSNNSNYSYDLKPEYQGHLLQFNRQRGGNHRVQQYDKFALGGRVNNVFDNINDLNRIIETHLYSNNNIQYGGENQPSPQEISRYNNVDKTLRTRLRMVMGPQYENIFKDLTKELKKRKKALKPQDHKKITDMIRELRNNELILNDILLAENIYIHALDVYGTDLTKGSSLSYDELEKIAEAKNKKMKSIDKKITKLHDIVIKLGLIAGYP